MRQTSDYLRRGTHFAVNLGGLKLSRPLLFSESWTKNGGQRPPFPPGKESYWFLPHYLAVSRSYAARQKKCLLTQGGISSTIHSRFCSLPYFSSSLHSPKNSHTNLAHCHHHPPLSRWRQQRQQHGNGGDKDDTATPVTARRWQRDSRAVAEGIARRQRWQGYCSGGGGGGAAAALAWRSWVARWWRWLRR